MNRHEGGAEDPAAPSPASPIEADWLQTLRQDGATFRTDHQRSIVDDFGDPETEYRHLTRGAGALVEVDHAVIEVTGKRALQMLGGLVSNDVEPLDEGRAVYAFVLTPKGRPLAEVRLLRDTDRVALDAPAPCLANLLDHLRRYLPPLYARFRLLEGVVKLAVVGPRAGEAWQLLRGVCPWASHLPPFDELSPLQMLTPGTASSAEGELGIRLDWLVRREEIEGPGFDLYLAGQQASAVWRDLRAAAGAAGGGPAGRRAMEVWRVERGIPTYGREISLERLPQETGQEARAISFTKGCYTGQEVVARIHYRGHVNRLLRGLAFRAPSDADPAHLLPAAGTELHQRSRPVGLVTTAVRSPRLGPIGLGYIRREVSPGAELSLAPGGPPEARVVALPFTST